ncbi:putative gamma-secretase aspartyl protease complex, presenilin enhancer-2 subunit [Dioscorea sansibarensis]
MERRRDQDDDEERRHLSGGGIVLPAWPTVDGPLGLSPDESVAYARRFFRWGFVLLPWLWAVNCLYFWPVLRVRPSDLPASSPFALLRPYVLRSAIGFTLFTVLLSIWAFTFMIGGKSLFGSVWDDIVMYNVADKLGLTGWY